MPTAVTDHYGNPLYVLPRATRVVTPAHSPSLTTPTSGQRLPPHRELTQQQWILAHQKLKQEKKQLEAELRQCQNQLRVLEKEKADAERILEEIRSVAHKQQGKITDNDRALRSVQERLQSIEALLSHNKHELEETQERLRHKEFELTRIKELALNYLKGIRSRLEAEIPPEFKHHKVLGHNDPNLMGNIHSDILDDIDAIKKLKAEFHKTFAEYGKQHAQLAANCNREKVETLTSILEAMHKDFPILSKAETSTSKSQNPAELVTKIFDKLHRIHNFTTVHAEISGEVGYLYDHVKKQYGNNLSDLFKDPRQLSPAQKIQILYSFIETREKQLKSLIHSSSTHHAEIQKHTRNLNSIKTNLARFETEFTKKIVESGLMDSNGIFRTFTREKKAKFAAKCAEISREILADIVNRHN